MRIPGSIRIGGIDYIIEYGDNLRIGNEICYGIISYNDCTITISTSDSSSHQPSALPCGMRSFTESLSMRAFIRKMKSRLLRF